MSMTKTKAKIICTVIIYAAILIWSKQYYSTPILMFEADTYKIKTQTEQVIILESTTNTAIEIEIYEKKRVVNLLDQQYTIEEDASSPIYNHVLKNPKTYDVTYPNGNKYQVQKSPDDSFFFVYRENRELYDRFELIVNEEGTTTEIRESEVEKELYHPENIVKVAFTQFYGTQGIWWLFFISLNLMTYGCLLLLSKRVRMSVFHLEHGLDAVPSNKYFVKLKIGAVVFIMLSAIVFYKSL